MGGAVSAGLDNDDLIDNLVDGKYIKTQLVERVFRSVDRAFYFLPQFHHIAYKDIAWKHGNIHISAPCIYSEVMEHLDLNPGNSFLNIGSGTGYLSTMAGLLLGTYGLNHGIELHQDVINYAYERLETFKKSCSAIDIFDFCEPLFIQGNGFLLNNRSGYDRVYCGAACPENCESYMKDLIKVGGILVMPCNDDLLRIKRISETEWVCVSILPVSFSTLQLPNIEDVKTIDLPKPEPLSLQDLSRSYIRQVLKEVIEKENPQLKDIPQRSKTRNRPSKEITSRRKPLFYLNSVVQNEISQHRPSELVEGTRRNVMLFDDCAASISGMLRRMIHMNRSARRIIHEREHANGSSSSSDSSRSSSSSSSRSSSNSSSSRSMLVENDTDVEDDDTSKSNVTQKTDKLGQNTESGNGDDLMDSDESLEHEQIQGRGCEELVTDKPLEDLASNVSTTSGEQIERTCMQIKSEMNQETIESGEPISDGHSYLASLIFDKSSQKLVKCESSNEEIQEGPSSSSTNKIIEKKNIKSYSYERVTINNGTDNKDSDDSEDEEMPKKLLKREKLDSGVGDDSENSSSENESSTSLNSSSSSSSPSSSSSSTSSSSFFSSIPSSSEMDCDDHNYSEQFFAPQLPCSSSLSSVPPNPSNESLVAYTKNLIEKVNHLPLPKPLKLYLCYNKVI